MAHDKYSTWNRQIWHAQKIVLYKNSTACQKMSKGYFPKTELSEEILEYVLLFRVMVIGF